MGEFDDFFAPKTPQGGEFDDFFAAPVAQPVNPAREMATRMADDIWEARFPTRSGKKMGPRGTWTPSEPRIVEGMLGTSQSQIQDAYKAIDKLDYVPPPEANERSVNRFINTHVALGDIRERFQKEGKIFDEPEFRRALMDQIQNRAAQSARERSATDNGRAGIMQALGSVPVAGWSARMGWNADLAEAKKRIENKTATQEDYEAITDPDARARHEEEKSGWRKVADVIPRVASDFPTLVAGAPAFIFTAAMEGASERMAHQGGEIYSPKNLVPATGMAAVQGTILGKMGGAFKGLANPIARTAARTGVAIGEQSAADVASGVLDEFLPDDYKSGGKYGLAGQIERGEWQKAGINAAQQTLMFGAFALAHTLKEYKGSPNEAIKAIETGYDAAEVRNPQEPNIQNRPGQSAEEQGSVPGPKPLQEPIRNPADPTPTPTPEAGRVAAEVAKTYKPAEVQGTIDDFAKANVDEMAATVPRQYLDVFVKNAKQAIGQGEFSAFASPEGNFDLPRMAAYKKIFSGMGYDLGEPSYSKKDGLVTWPLEKSAKSADLTKTPLVEEADPYTLSGLKDIAAKSGLDAKQQRVVELLADGMKLREVGEHPDIMGDRPQPYARERIRQIAREALDKMGVQVKSIADWQAQLKAERAELLKGREDAATGTGRVKEDADLLAYEKAVDELIKGAKDGKFTPEEIALANRIGEEYARRQGATAEADAGQPADAVSRPKFVEKAKSAADAAKERLNKKYSGRLLSGFDPTDIPDAAIYFGGRLVEKGYDFAKFTKDAIGAFGEEVKPYLQAIWDKANGSVSEYKAIEEVGLAHQIRDEARVARGLDPILKQESKSDKIVWEEAMAEIAKDPSRPDQLIAELTKKPRSLSPTEEMILLHRSSELSERFDKAEDQLAKAKASGDSAQIVAAEHAVSASLADLNVMDQVASYAGSEAGRAFRLRRAVLADDMSMPRVVSRVREALGADPTPEQMDQIRKLTKENRELKTKLDVAESIANRRKVEDEILGSKRPNKTSFARKEVDAAWERFSKVTQGLSANRFADPEVLAATYNLAKAYVKLNVAKVQDFIEIVAQGRELSDEYKAMLTEQFEKAKGEPVGKTTVRFDPTKTASVSRAAQKLAKQFVESGIKDRDALIDAVHAEIIKVMPEMSRREVMDAISGYGQYKQLSKEQASVELRDLKGQMQQIGKLEDMQAGSAPLKTGVERRIPSDTERGLIKQVGEAKKAGGFDVTDPETQLKTFLDTTKTRLTNQIADLTKQIETGQKAAKNKATPAYDQEALDLIQRRDALKEQFDAIFGKPEKTDAERLADMKSRLSDRIAEINERISSGNIEEPTKRAPVAPDDELISLRADYNRSVVKIKQMIEAYKQSQEGAVAKTFRTAGKVLDLQRAIKLGGDLPPIFRQGGMVTAGHPLLATKALAETAKAFKSERGAYHVGAGLEGRENSKNGLYKRAMNLDVNDVHGQDEFIQSMLIQRVPGFAQLQRWNSSFLTHLRADYFDNIAAGLSKSGKVSEAEAKVIGNLVNVFTGRGNLAQAEQAIGILNKFFLAPKWVASRFQAILPVPGNPLLHGITNPEIGLQPRARAAVAKEYLRAGAGYSAVYGLVGLASALGIANVSVEWDPRSSDFGEIRIGNTRINPLSGLSQIARFVSQFATGQKKNVSTGGIYKSPRATIAGGELRNKLAPIPGTAWNALELATGTKPPPGRPKDAFGVGLDLLLPITAKDFWDASKDLGLPKGVALGIIASLGAGLKTYSNANQRPGPAQRPGPVLR